MIRCARNGHFIDEAKTSHRAIGDDRFMCNDCWAEWAVVQRRAWKEFLGELTPPSFVPDPMQGMSAARQVEAGIILPVGVPE